MSDTPEVDPAVLAEAERQHALIMRGTAYGDSGTRATMSRELRQRLIESLQADRPLRVYLGVDPTSPDLHIGHCVTLRKLQLFQQLGHQSILLIGDFTGLVGDPVGQGQRPPDAGGGDAGTQRPHPTANKPSSCSTRTAPKCGATANGWAQ